MGSTSKRITEAGMIIGGLGVIGFLGLIWLMIYGNMSGNLGFATGTQGYNDTQTVINNMTAGFKTFFGFSGTFFTIAAIVLLIFMLLGLLALAMSIMGKYSGSKSGFSE